VLRFALCMMGNVFSGGGAARCFQKGVVRVSTVGAGVFDGGHAGVCGPCGWGFGGVSFSGLRGCEEWVSVLVYAHLLTVSSLCRGFACRGDGCLVLGVRLDVRGDGGCC